MDRIDIPDLPTLVGRVQGQASAQAPLDQLHAAAALSADLAARADELTGYFVDAARRAGCSWTEIGAVLGVSKQAAQQRFVPVDIAEFGCDEIERPMTDRLRRAIRHAHKEAKRLGVDYVDTEHLLLGMLYDRRALAGRMLTEVGADPDELVHSVHTQFTPGTAAGSSQGTLTQASVRALDLSLRESRAFGHNYLGTEHVLLGLAALSEGLAHNILTEHGADHESLRRTAHQLLHGPCLTQRRRKLRVRRG